MVPTMNARSYSEESGILNDIFYTIEKIFGLYPGQEGHLLHNRLGPNQTDPVRVWMIRPMNECLAKGLADGYKNERA